MIRGDFHTHTAFCDGADAPEDMVLAAISKGLEKIGFSGHSYTSFDTTYGMSAEKCGDYKKTIRGLQEKYRGRIEIFCGVEQDFYSDFPADGFDYIIGSVHYLKLGDEFVPVDEGNEVIKKAAEKYFGGDIMSLCEEYYKTVASVAEKTNCDIIGHFDLITKFNEKERVIDTCSERYIKAWKKAADRLLKTGLPFEINSGAVAKGYKTEQYPSTEILRYLAKNGGTAVLSSDSHSVNTLCFDFDKNEALAKSLGLSFNYPKKFGL